MLKAAFALGALVHSFPALQVGFSWRHCHSSSGFSLSQFLHIIADRLEDDQIRSLCGALAVVRLLVHTKISLNYYN